jgi:hypothetical protein
MPGFAELIAGKVSSGTNGEQTNWFLNLGAMETRFSRRSIARRKTKASVERYPPNGSSSP